MRNFAINLKYFQIIFILLICMLKLRIVFCDCDDDEWNCDDGSCISSLKKCDGIPDCSDGSDEIAENCIQNYRSCQKFAFTCTYGACITRSHKCNGIKDCSDNSDELVCKATRQSDLQGECGPEELQCLQSKECIGAEYMCDGHRDCSDGSDETVEVCADFECHEVGFHCGYGGCINQNAKCNGTIECPDGSDEAWELCNTPRKSISLRGQHVTSNPTSLPTPTPKPTPMATPTPIPTPTGIAKCFIPNNVLDVTIKLHPQNLTISTGTWVDDESTIHLECNNRDSIVKGVSLYCDNGKFNNDFPTCMKYCNGALLKGLSTYHHCYRNGQYVLCGNKIPPGIDIEVICAPGFRRKNARFHRQNIKCLPSGQFDVEREKCVPECGIVQKFIIPLTQKGINVKPNDVPWHVGIYERDDAGQYAFICGGSLISPSLILSAAHCFWNNTLQRMNPTSNYIFMAGKYTRQYNTQGDERPQMKEAALIETSREFRGTRNFSNADAALIKLVEPFRYNDNISSVCLNLGDDAATDYIGSDISGDVTGYGQKFTLEKVPMKTVDFITCSRMSDTQGLTNDKFCLKSEGETSICRGDSGGGFVVKQTFMEIYILWGIISYTPSTQLGCARSGFVSATNVRYIKRDLKRIIEKRMEEDTLLF